MPRYYFGTDCSTLLTLSENEIIGQIALSSPFPDEPTQKHAWKREIEILKLVLPSYQGKVYFEFDVPRMGKRIDVVLLIKSVIFVLEFKVGESVAYLERTIPMIIRIKPRPKISIAVKLLNL